MIKIATIVGARPQFIKAATVSRAIAKRQGVTELLIHTGQHFDVNMSDLFFNELDIRKPDVNLAIGGGTHGQNTGRMIESIEGVLLDYNPDHVMVYGDTDSTLAGALAAVKIHIPIAHVEAGLRSFNRLMPEEINRVLTDHISDLLFAPTETASKNLRQEGINETKVHLVGDVMYDASLYYRERSLSPKYVKLIDGTPFYLCTIHRAENTDDPKRLKAIVSLINQISKDTNVVLPLHPRTRLAIKNMDKEAFSEGVKVLHPVGYLEMAWLLANCQLVLTDSGGVQKEAYFYQKPCVTLREETEWVELVEAGCNQLVSPVDPNAANSIQQMSSVQIEHNCSIYGNGDAAGKLLSLILD